jgi:hypothetical protein
MTRRAIRPKSPLDCKLSYDPDRQCLYIRGRDLDADLISVGELVRRGVIGVPAAIVHTDDSGLSWLIRNRVLRCLCNLWKVSPRQEVRR